MYYGRVRGRGNRGRGYNGSWGGRSRGGRGGGGNFPLTSTPPQAKFCRNYINGTCRANKCIYKHELKKIFSHQTHTGGVSDCAQMPNSFLITVGDDQHLRVWECKMVQPASMEANSQADIQLPNPASCVCAYEDFIFCGMETGLILAISVSTGNQQTLQGHQGAVTSILVHENVVITGSLDGTLRFWQPDATTGGFQLMKTMEAQTAINFMVILNLGVDGVTASPSLWVGGTHLLSVYHLPSMEQVSSMRINASVMGMAEFQGNHAIVGLSDGSVAVFDAQLHCKYEDPPSDNRRNISSLAVTIDAQEKGVLVVGKDNGWTQAYDLPTFEDRGCWAAHQSSNFRQHQQPLPRIHRILYTGGYTFCTAAADGNLVIWQWTPKT